MRIQLITVVHLLISLVCSLPLYAQPATQPEHVGLERLFGANDPRVVEARGQLEDDEKKHADLINQIRDLTKAAQDATGRIEISADILHRAAGKLDDQFFELQLETDVGESRIDAISKQIAMLGTATTRASEMDVVTNELEKVVELKQKAFDQIAQSNPAGATKISDTDHIVSVGDVLQITLTDLEGPGKGTDKTCRVSESGMISLPYIGQIKAAGLHEADLEHAISKKFQDMSLAKDVPVSVAVLENVPSPKQDVESAAAELAEAKARLALQREHDIAAAGGDAIIALRKQLIDLTVAQAEYSGRLHDIEVQREKMKRGLEIADRLQQIEAEAKAIELDIQQLTK